MSNHSSPPASRRWLGLAVIAAAQFMVIMDTSIIGVALPQMQDDLGFSQENLSWVFNAYVVAFGGLLLLGGKLSDLFGARRVFTAGWVTLIAGSAAAGMASDVGVELAGRAVQGAGAALIAPSALTMLMMLFGGNPRELTKAFALYGAAAPAGGTAGVFFGGLITEYGSWPWVFTAGLAALVYGIVQAPEVGWGSARTWLVLAGAAALLVGFVALQASRREPLIRLGIFRAPNLGAANLAQLLLGAAWIPMWFFLNLYLQQVLGYTAFPSGAALVPMTVLIMIGMVVLAPRAIGRFGPKNMTVAGLLLLAAGMVWLSFVRPGGSFVTDVLPASLVAALGMSLAFIPTLGTAISAARPEEGGLASGIVNTSYQVGSAIGLAAMTAIAAAYGADRIGDPVALTDGFSAAFLGAAVVALIGAVATALLFRSAAPESVPSDPDGVTVERTV
ncbi:MFS transporter [Rhodococcus hoagii]|nr:MFS transporter [Prescottella equi]